MAVIMANGLSGKSVNVLLKKAFREVTTAPVEFISVGEPIIVRLTAEAVDAITSKKVNIEEIFSNYGCHVAPSKDGWRYTAFNFKS